MASITSSVSSNFSKKSARHSIKSGAFSTTTSSCSSNSSFVFAVTGTQINGTLKVPLICVPVTAKTKEELEEQLEVVVEKAPDLIEWRADFFEKLDDTELVIEAIHDIKEKTAVPLLFTIRSEKEGGEAISLTEAEKVELINVIAEKTNIDFIDYEVKNDRAHVEKVRDMTKKNDVGLILSFHDFTKTPSE